MKSNNKAPTKKTISVMKFPVKKGSLNKICANTIEKAEELGCVFSDDKTTLVRFNNDEVSEFIIPDGETRISEMLF